MTGQLFDAREPDASGRVPGSARSWGVSVSLLIHAGGAAGLLLLSLLVPEALPPVKAGQDAVTIPIAPILRVKLPAVEVRPVATRRGGGGRAGLAVPAPPRVQVVATPAVVAPLPDLDAIDPGSEWLDGLQRCWHGCGSGTGQEGSGGDDWNGPTKWTDVGPVRVGVHTGIAEPRKLRHVEPIYPPLARAAGIQGRVVLECTLGLDGFVRDLRVVQGNALLNAAAIAAVERWLYVPTLLNGVPVPVVLSVTVDFRLR